jgi:hypothetical protein
MFFSKSQLLKQLALFFWPVIAYSREKRSDAPVDLNTISSVKYFSS